MAESIEVAWSSHLSSPEDKENPGTRAKPSEAFLSTSDDQVLPLQSPQSPVECLHLGIQSSYSKYELMRDISNSRQSNDNLI